MNNLALIQENGLQTYVEIKNLRDEVVWVKMRDYQLSQIIDEWLATLVVNTRLAYRSGLNKLIEYRLVDPSITLQEFSLINHDAIVDRIKHLPMKEATKQARAALYISFTRYLSRRFTGMFHKAQPCKEGTDKTFYTVNHKCVTNAMNQMQWIRFFECLEKINPRDCLIGKLALQGGKRISEVLNLKIENIDFEKGEIHFIQSKTRGLFRETVITYSHQIMENLRNLVCGRSGLVFLSRNNTPVLNLQVQNTFCRAGKDAGIPFKVTPHVLRASAVTHLKKQGFADSDIMKITGHTNSQQILAYDKSEQADNPSKRVNLI